VGPPIGTFKDTEGFAEHCGFPNDNEQELLKILKFKDVYDQVK
jgi:hypothetical protein